MTVRKTSEICCDGCGKKVEWWCRDARPEDWRRLRVYDGFGKSYLFDVCSPHCASRVVDSTYVKADLDELARRRMRST
jgi:hypothetical protein